MKKSTYPFNVILFLTFSFLLYANQSKSQINLDSGLVGFFKMDGNAADSSSQLNHGTSTSVTDAQGIHPLNQTGYSFNGTSSSINAGTSNRGVTHTVSVSAWIKTTDISSTFTTVVSKYHWQSDKGYFIRMKNGYPAIHGRNNNGSYVTTSNTSVFVADGNWHHVLGVVASNKWELWIDGILIDTENTFASNPAINNLSPTTIGAIHGNGFLANYFDGDIDEVRIYNRELLSTEIAYLANQESNDVVTSVTTCSSSYPSPWNSNVWTTSGTYSSITYGSDVADSLEIVNLVIDTIHTNISQVSGQLKAVSNVSYTYQWVDCSMNLPIIGEQDSIYTPLQNGSYAVIVSNGNCSDTSSCVSFTRSVVNLTSDLVADFRFNGNQGDSSVQNIHGTGYFLTSTNGINNQNNKAYDFNGISSKVVCGTNNRSITHSVSVSAWVKTTVTTGNYFVVEKYNWPSDRGYALFIKNGIPLMQARNTSGAGAHTYDYVNQQTFYVNDGQWHHIVGVVNQNNIEIWVDGVLEATATQTATNPDLTTTSNLNIGYNGYSSNNYFLGSIDEVKIFKSGIDSLQIDSLYRSRNTYLNLTASKCSSYTSPSGKVWYQSGVYSDTVSNTLAGDTIYTVTLNIGTSNTTVTPSGDTLYAYSDPSYQYQWIECTSGLPIVGATGGEFVPSQSGSYSVVISSGNCADTSICHSVTIPPVNLSTGLVGYFKFDGNVADSSTQLGHGTPTSLTGASGIKCVSNTAYDFNGASSKVVAGTGNRGVTHTVNISAWVKTTKSTGYQNVVEKYDWPTDRGYALTLKHGVPYIIARNGSGNGIHTWNANQTFAVSDGQWHHLFAKVSQNNLEIWVDGVLKATATQTATNPILTNTNNLNFGYYYQGTISGSTGPGYFDGAIDEIRLYNRDLAVNEIQALINSRNIYVNSSVIACSEYTSPSGNDTWRNSGIHTDTVSSSCGGDSIFNINLTVNGPNVAVTRLGDSLLAVSNSSYTYQWINCTNGETPISGEISSSFVPVRSGSYAVEITSNGCVDTSSCTSVYVDDNTLPYTNAIFMDGVNNYLEIPNHTNLHSTTNLTLEAWIKPCKVSGTNVIYSKIWCSGQQNSYFFSVQDGKLKWVWYTGNCGASNGVNRYKSTSAIIQNDVWQHVAVVHSPTGVKMFLNGVEVVASLEVGSYGNLRSSTEPIRVGTYKSLSGNLGLKFSGQMDELRVWNQSVSDSLIFERYNSPLLGTEIGLQGYYNLDNYTTGPNEVIPNNAVALGSAGNALTKGSSSYITPFYLNNTTSFILGEDTTLCTPSSLVFDATIPAGTYTWQNGSTASTHSSTNGGNINVSFSNTCVSTVDTVIKIVPPVITVDLGNDTAICNVSNFILDAGTTGANYAWSDGSTGQTLTVNQNGIYGVTVSNSCHTATDSIEISGFIATSYVSVSSCDTYTSPSGNYIWGSSGVYQDTVISSLGCDSIIEVNLIITPIAITTISASSCYSYPSPSGTKTWFTSGTHYDTLQSVNGCDSVLEVSLAILPYEIVNITETVCNSYTSPTGNNTWTSSGNYLELVSHTNDCDTLYNINLTVLSSSNATFTTTLCSPFVSPSGKIWASSGVYQDTIPNAMGCDSIMSFNLTYYPVNSVIVNKTSCSNYTWLSNGVTYWTSGVYVDTLLSVAGCDSINTLNLTINSGDTNTTSVSACGSYYWPVTGTTYTQSGQYTQLFNNQLGCDSLLELDLTINNSSTGMVNIVTCDSYISPSGIYTWVSSGTYMDTIQNITGCDSIITVNLTINNSYTFNTTEVACSNYTWLSNGVTYWTSGVYVDTLLSVTGCDSINTLNLTINSGDTSTVLQTGCDSYYWPISGITYTSNIVDTIVYAKSNGCDSIFVLDLTINPSDTVFVNEQSCGDYYWAADGNIYTTGGVYSTTLTNSSGCDSLVTLSLMIHQPNDTILSISNCGSYFWSQTGATYLSSGVYSDTIQNGQGCDSIVNLDLTILDSTSETLNELACGWYTAPDGAIYDSTGQYQAIIPNTMGCDSIITINLQVTKTDTSVTRIGAELFAVSNTNYQYQWIDCVTNNPIVGETDSIFSPTVNGKYAVEITNGPCFETSSCIDVLNVGISEFKLRNIQLYPNPVYDYLTISVKDVSTANITITDATGKQVLHLNVTKGENRIDCSKFVAGLYLVHIESAGLIKVEKVIVR